MLTTILSFLAVLGVLIFIHELGHFLAARHVGVRVEAFSVGFPPTAWGKQVGETEYRISWVPIGGYVNCSARTSMMKIRMIRQIMLQNPFFSAYTYWPQVRQ